MEGISDGLAVDSCYYCALLHPELNSGPRPCPECGNRLRYLVAEMLSSAELEVRLDALVRRFHDCPGRDTARDLLRFLHRFGDEAVELVTTRNRTSLAELGRSFGDPWKPVDDASA